MASHPEKIAPFYPSLVDGIGDKLFGKRADEISPASEMFGAVLHDTVAALASARGIDFDSLPPNQQVQHQLAFLREIYVIGSRTSVLSRETSGARDSSNDNVIEVSPNRVTLHLKKGDDYDLGTVSLDFVQKRMLAYFVGLTQAKVDRLLVPWITRAELVTHTTEYTKEQLHAHMFRPLDQAGLLEVSGRWGYRLASDPKEVLKAIQSGESNVRMEVAGFDGWSRAADSEAILMHEHYLPVITALYEQCKTATPDQYVDLTQVREATALSRGVLYDNLNLFEDLGVIRRGRRGDRYTVGDINSGYIAQVIQRQEEPIVVSVRGDKKRPVQTNIEGGRTEIHSVVLKEISEFPQIAWVDKNVPVKPIEEGSDTLTHLLDVLTTDLKMDTVFSNDNKLVYSSRLPVSDKLDRPTTLGVLDYLGLGPEELRRIDRISYPTLAALLRSMEEKTEYVQDEQLVAEIKIRIASLIYGKIQEPGEVNGLGIREIMNDLDLTVTSSEEVRGDNQDTEPKAVVLEEIEDGAIFEAQRRAEMTPVVVNESLLRAMRGAFEKELLFATSQEAVPTSLMMPVAAFNYHRSLSPKAGRIPWRELKSLGLAHEGERDHHPLFEPVGALVAALYLNSSIRARVFVASRGKHDAVRMVARHVAHLLKETNTEGKADGHPDGKGAYIEHSLGTLTRERLTCVCDKCA